MLLILIELCFVNCSQEDYYDTDLTMANRKTTRSVEISQMIPYPSVDLMLSDPIIKQKTDEAWENTKNSALSGKRIEYGFWIYYNFKTQQFICGKVVEGHPASSGSRATIDIGNPLHRNDSVDYCACFHTHPPFFGIPNEYEPKPVGFSQEDVDFAKQWNVPGIVCDYVSPVQSRDSVNNSYTLYPFGASQRLGFFVMK